jgi:hypothetical protein
VTVITITGLGDHDQLDWLITMTGIRNLVSKICCDADAGGRNAEARGLRDQRGPVADGHSAVKLCKNCRHCKEMIEGVDSWLLLPPVGRVELGQ